MKVVISNFSRPINKTIDFKSYWESHIKPKARKRLSLFQYKADWGFHIYSIGVYLMDVGIADEVEFWDYSEERTVSYHPFGVLRVMFYNERDVMAYLNRYGCPDLYINHGRYGLPILKYLEGKCFRVHVPALRTGLDHQCNLDADCYLVDSEEYLDDRSMLYIPVVNTKRIYPINCEKKRDFIYLASLKPNKRHDILLKSVRGTELTGHLHPVDGTKVDLTNTNITTTDLNGSDVVDLLRTSRIAVYPGDNTSNPAAMWECVAAGLPIVVNENIKGGRHLVVPGVTGEFASEDNFYDVMKHVLANLDSYRPREYFMENWDTVSMLEKYLAYFRKMGLRY
ncbi:MAG: glycosyltransferase [Thermodesulfobacteriota bacterium]